MIRWEARDDGDWGGFSGELAVAAVTRARGGAKPRWDWEVGGVERPQGWRNAGHRTSALAARRAADEYWSRWLKSAALKPDVERLAELS